MLVMTYIFRWKIEGVKSSRAEYSRLRKASVPVLICANHLTKLDSALIGWALGGMTFYYAISVLSLGIYLRGSILPILGGLG